MTTTTSYGTWQNFTPGELSVRQGIEAALGDDVGDFDVDAIETHYRSVINGYLSGTGITLNGDEFYGPAGEECPTHVIAEVVGYTAMSFWDIVHKHEI